MNSCSCDSLMRYKLNGLYLRKVEGSRLLFSQRARIAGRTLIQSLEEPKGESLHRGDKTNIHRFLCNNLYLEAVGIVSQEWDSHHRALESLSYLSLWLRMEENLLMRLAGSITRGLILNQCLRHRGFKRSNKIKVTNHDGFHARIKE